MASGEAEQRGIISRALSHLEIPLHVFRDLLTIGVCARCLFRLFGCQEHVYSCSVLTDTVLHSVLEELNESSVDSDLSGLHSVESSSTMTPEAAKDRGLCSICLGILQFSHNNGEGVDKNPFNDKTVKDFTEEVAGAVKAERHEIDAFSIEVSLPPIMFANERSIWFHLKEKYGSQDWMEDKFHKCISVKDALKLSITSSLQNCLAVKNGTCPFRIRLIYTHLVASEKLQDLFVKDQSYKKRKLEKSKENNDASCTDKEHCNGAEVSFVGSRKECLQHPKSESDAIIQKVLEGLDDRKFSECFGSPPTMVNTPCKLAIFCYRMPIYIGGRYLKFSRKVSQSRWIIDDQRMGEASVEEIIGNNVLAVCKGDSYKFHAAGREDIDVRMLGSGRPFLIEVSNAHLLPSSINVQEIADIIDQSKHKYVSVRNLKVLGSEGWELMREGEAEKQKQYAALVWTSRLLSEGDLEKISSTKDLDILQRTPIRVLHRRSPLERNRTIHWMKMEKVGVSSQYFLLHLCTQAGTYIKEFVHGDLGRTHPSIGSILGCTAEILQLDVTDVKMDNFL